MKKKNTLNYIKVPLKLAFMHFSLFTWVLDVIFFAKSSKPDRSQMQAYFYTTVREHIFICIYLLKYIYLKVFSTNFLLSFMLRYLFILLYKNIKMSEVKQNLNFYETKIKKWI